MGSGGVERMACEEVSCCAADNAAACKEGAGLALCWEVHVWRDDMRTDVPTMTIFFLEASSAIFVMRCSDTRVRNGRRWRVLFSSCHSRK